MKRLYLQPKTTNEFCMPKSHLLLLSNPPDPQSAPTRQFQGETKSLKYLI